MLLFEGILVFLYFLHLIVSVPIIFIYLYVYMCVKCVHIHHMCINAHSCPSLTSCHLRTVITFCYQSLLYVGSGDSISGPHTCSTIPFLIVPSLTYI